MSDQWMRMHKQDPYYKHAKAEGYRSRAAYKLKQINNKFKLIRNGDLVLDLGSAPGGWAQVATELVGKSGKVVGVDLDQVDDVDDVTFLVGDITERETVEMIKELLNGELVDVLISDASPNISGNYSVDQARSVYLAEAALDMAKQFLKPGGNFIVKVFEGSDFSGFISKIKSAFRKRKNLSPAASRSRSSEIYAIGIGFKK